MLRTKIMSMGMASKRLRFKTRDLLIKMNFFKTW